MYTLLRCKPVPGKPAVELSELVAAVLAEMQKFGAITLVRVPQGVMNFTFQSSVSAMHALQLDETEVGRGNLRGEGREGMGRVGAWWRPEGRAGEGRDGPESN